MSSNPKQKRNTSSNRLRDLQIKKSKPIDYPLQDGGGLTLHLKPSGAKCWSYRYTFAKHRREAGLGAYPVVSLDAARAERDRFDALIKQGLDPIQERSKQAQESAQRIEADTQERKQKAFTVAVACRDYHARTVETTAKSPKHAAQWISSLENHIFPVIGSRPVVALTRGEVLDVVQTVMTKLPETGRRVRQRLEAVFDELVFKDVMSSNLAAQVRRQVKVPSKGKLVKHHRSLVWLLPPSLYQRLEQSTSTASLALRLALLTAARTDEALHCSWNEIDLRKKEWTIPAERMKAGRPHKVFLSEQALAVLQIAKTFGRGYVFPSPDGLKKPLSNMAMLNLLDRIEFRGLTTVHGLRATFSTWANEHGFHRDVIEASLAHVEGDKVRAAYNHAQYLEHRRNLMDEWGTFVVGLHAQK